MDAAKKLKYIGCLKITTGILSDYLNFQLNSLYNTAMIIILQDKSKRGRHGCALALFR